MIYPPVRGNGAWNYGRVHFCITHSGLLSVQGLQFRPLAVCNLGQWFVLLNREQSCSSYNDGFEGKHADSLQYRLKIGKNWVWRAFYRYSFFSRFLQMANCISVPSTSSTFLSLAKCIIYFSFLNSTKNVFQRGFFFTGKCLMREDKFLLDCFFLQIICLLI